MPPKQRQIRIEQKSALAAMQRLETRSDDELLAETKHRAAAQAILGARAAETYEPKAARLPFQKAIAAARPQERMRCPWGASGAARASCSGALVAAAALDVLAIFGRRGQNKAKAEREARGPG